MGIIGLIVAIPVFFDVALIILAPIVFSRAKKAGKAPHGSMRFWTQPIAVLPLKSSWPALP